MFPFVIVQKILYSERETLRFLVLLSFNVNPKDTEFYLEITSLQLTF